MNNRSIYIYLSVTLLSVVAHVESVSAQREYSVEECVEMAISNNEKIIRGEIDIEASQQRVREAYTHYFPSVEATASGFKANNGLIDTNVDLEGVIPAEVAAMLPADLAPLLAYMPSSVPVSMLESGVVAGVTAMVPIYAGREIVNSNRLAKVGHEVAKVQQAMNHNEVTLAVYGYYAGIVNLREKLVTLEFVEEMLKTLHRDVEAAVKAGLTTRNDMLRVELQQQKIRSDRSRLENGIRLCNMQLAQYIGADMTTFGIVMSRENFQTPTLPASREVMEAVMSRDEVTLLDHSVEAATLQRRITLANNMPKVGVGAGYLYNNLLGESATTGLVFGTISVPISKWWGGSHAVKRSRLMEERAIKERDNAIEMLTLQTRQVWDELTEAHTQIEIAEKSIESATENLRMTQSAYEAGTVTMSELLDAQMLLQQSRNQYSDSRSIYSVKELNYRQIVGL